MLLLLGGLLMLTGFILGVSVLLAHPELIWLGVAVALMELGNFLQGLWAAQRSDFGQS